VPDPITDLPSPEHQAETERLAGELLKGGPATPDAVYSAEWRALVKPIVLRMHREKLAEVVIRKDGGQVRFTAKPAEVVPERVDAAGEIDALRSKVSDLSAALAREAERLAAAERERDALRAVCLRVVEADACDLPESSLMYLQTIASEIRAAGPDAEPEGGA
jgi:hypothetical protein